MATYARPGDTIREIVTGELVTIISDRSHHCPDYPRLTTPKTPWSKFDLDGVYEFVGHSIIDRVLAKYLNSEDK
jgi:hypothetical protein